MRERFARNRHIDVDVLCANIEYTRFPVPYENEGEAATDYPGLLRDFIERRNSWLSGLQARAAA